MAHERVSKFSAESYDNMIGQTLNPGDKVVCVTTGYGHRVSVFEGIFEGVYRSNCNDKITGTRVGKIPVTYYEREFADDGDCEETFYRTKYDSNGRYNGYEFVPTGRRYNLIPKTNYRVSSLKLNRVFRIDTPLTKVVI